MKFFFLLILLVITSATLFGQAKFVPSYKLKDIDGKEIDIQDSIKEKNTVMVFWASWSSPAKRELDLISKYQQDWQTNYDVQIVAVNVDELKTQKRAIDYANSKKQTWKYMFLFDPSAGLKISETVLFVNAKGEIVFEVWPFTPGDELEYDKKVKEIFKN